MSAASARPDPRLEPDESTDHVRGPAAAPVTLIEYGDFECPSCRQAYGALAVMLPHFGDRLRLVFRHYPVHPHAQLAAEAAEAAGAQGRFWPMHDLLFEHQQHLERDHLLELATRLELDMARFRNDLDGHAHLQRVQADLASGGGLGLRSTPSFFVNGVLSDVTFGPQHLHEAIDHALLGR